VQRRNEVKVARTLAVRKTHDPEADQPSQRATKRGQEHDTTPTRPNAAQEDDEQLDVAQPRVADDLDQWGQPFATSIDGKGTKPGLI
jgi:hypothetical protein